MSDAETVTHNSEASSFHIQVGEYRAHLDYRIIGQAMEIDHTFVPTELRGRGLAGLLAEAALSYAEANTLNVISHCSFIDHYRMRRRQ